MKISLINNFTSLLFLFIFTGLTLAFPLPAIGMTINAASCSRADVQAAISSASVGDTVNVPAGNCTWSSTLSLTRGITLLGAGRDSTFIISNGVMITIAPDATAITNEERIEIAGFTFDGNDTALVLIDVRGAGATAVKPFKSLVIGNNRFRDLSIAFSNSAAIRNLGQTRGVVYNNIFDRICIIWKLLGNDDTVEFSSGNFPYSTYGTSDNLYFEDNTIQFSSDFGCSDPAWSETGQGARIVSRYNTWDFANVHTGGESQDIHGFQNWPGNGQTGTMISEYYGNTWLGKSGFRWLNHRGLKLMVHNNIATGANPGDMEINQYAVGDAGGSGCTEDIPGASGVYTTVVQDTYAFNNTQSGIETPLVPGGVIGNGCGVSENNGYWNLNAACTASACSAGVGRGTTAPTGTCTTGVGYWVATTPTPTVNSEVVQNGTFYKCTATNTWTAYYIPFTYPHPLRTFIDTTPPLPPAGLMVQ